MSIFNSLFLHVFHQLKSKRLNHLLSKYWFLLQQTHPQSLTQQFQQGLIDQCQIQVRLKQNSVSNTLLILVIPALLQLIILFFLVSLGFSPSVSHLNRHSAISCKAEFYNFLWCIRKPARKAKRNIHDWVEQNAKVKK